MPTSFPNKRHKYPYFKFIQKIENISTKILNTRPNCIMGDRTGIITEIPFNDFI